MRQVEFVTTHNSMFFLWRIVIGKISTLTTEQIEVFENYRNSLNNIVIIIFDELFERISGLIAILSDKNISDSQNEQECDDELPF